MRFARTTSNGRLAAGQAALAGPDAPRTSRFRRALASVASIGDRVGVHAERRRGAELHRRDGEDPRAAADVEDARAGQLAAVRHDLERGEAQPGGRVEAGPEGHPRIERDDDVVRRRRWRRQVGRMTIRRPTRRTGKYAFQASAQSVSWTTRVWSSPIGRRPNAWR